MLVIDEKMEKHTMHKGPQVVLVPCPLIGHLTPMLELATILHSKGFSIIIMHALFNSPDPSHYPNFIFQPILENVIVPDPSAENLAEFLTVVNTQGKESLTNCMTQMMQQHGQHDKVACIIYDKTMYFAEAVANHMKLPSIILYTSSASTTRAYDIIPRLHVEGFIPVQVTQQRYMTLQIQLLCHRFYVGEPSTRTSSPQVKDLSLSEIGKLEDLIPMLEMSRNTGSSSAFIWNTTDYLENSVLSELQHVYRIPIFPIGPLHKMAPTSSSSLLEEDTSCITWLDKQAPLSVIYVCLGSLARIDEKTLVEMAYGLANSCQPFLWVVRPGCVRNSEWIEFLPEDFKEQIGDRGHIVKWAPQKEVLAHTAVGGFWSHCGWNSTLESISEGVPLLCMPSFADQLVNARYLSHEWRIGVHLEQDLQRGNIEKAIKLLMVGKEGEEMRQRANSMKEKINFCVQEGGASYNTLNEVQAFILSL